jgi:hypothetical protein
VRGMFTKISRYQKLPDIVTTDTRGQEFASKPLRLLPEVSGVFLHAVEEVDRLDHLAYKYYRQSRKWWRICDANPEFMSPLALLGDEAIVTDRFPVIAGSLEEALPWANLTSLLDMVGIEDVQLKEEEVALVEQEKTFDGEEVTVFVPRYERAVIVTYNRMSVDARAIIAAITAAGLRVGRPERIGRVGKSIVIPADAVG